MQSDLLHHPGVLAARGDLEHGAPRERGIARGIRAGDGGFAAPRPFRRAVPQPATGIRADDEAGGKAAPWSSLYQGNAGTGAGTRASESLSLFAAVNDCAFPLSADCANGRELATSLKNQAKRGPAQQRND